MDNLILSVLKKRGKSQGWLSKQTRIDRMQLNKIVRGITRHPQVHTAIKIAKALGVSVEDIWK